jgi:hypothetical protein
MTHVDEMSLSLEQARPLLRAYAREDRKRGWNRLTPLTERQLEISQQLLKGGIVAERMHPNQPLFHLLRTGDRKHKARFTVEG